MAALTTTSPERLFADHRHLARRAAYRPGAPVHVWDDLHQDALIGLWRAAGSWDGRGSFTGWARLVIAWEMMDARRFGEAGDRVVIEECLVGREASFFVVTDGVHARVLPSAEDHKRAYDGDRGPNTGGMGAFSPSPLVTPALSSRILADIVEPTLRGMAQEGRPYRGFLYCGLMITADGPKVIEFNARMGDPETQVVLPRLDEDLLPHLRAGRDRERRARKGE